MTHLALAKTQIEFARRYTQTLLEDVEQEDWFRMPDGVSHLAWQCGHLAMAQYALAILRIRGKEPEDAEFISSRFFKFFKKTSHPNPDPAANPSVDEILATMQHVHERALAEMDAYTSEQLQEPLPEPYVAESSKLGSLFFCSAHEMLHAGQIGLLRRALGKSPVR